ncbi:hypothetical protein BH20ACT11_BH20ACT11_00800 [soil metagenome]|jgi:hypothetical protein
MKKEGTGKPRNPDIEIGAGVRVSELHFEKAPESEVRFRGSTRRNSVWGSRRENLPDEVREGVVYHDAGVRLRIASEIADSGSDFENISDEERAKASRHQSRVSETSNGKAKIPTKRVKE